MHPSSSEYLMQDPNTSVSSHLDSSFGNLSRNVAAACFSPHLRFNDMDPRVLVNNPYLAANFNIPLQNGSYMNSSKCNMESYLNLPSHPVTMSNPRVTSSLGVDHLLVSDQFLEAVQGRAQQIKRQQNQLSILGPMSQSRLQSNQVAFPSLMKFDDSAQVQKRPRLDSNKDDLLSRYTIQQLLLSESPKQLQSLDLKLVALAREYQLPNALQKESSISLKINRRSLSSVSDPAETSA